MTKLKLFQSAAKPLCEEGSETISKESTPKGGSAMPQTDNAEGDDIVQKKSRLAFIQKANVKFNNKFDYSKVVYINAKTKVCIICPIHGEFWQTPDKHLQSKHGCPKCSNIKKGSNIKKTIPKNKMSKEDFLKIASKKYNNKFSYIIEDWKGLVNTTIKVMCPIHGEFIINARSHILNNNKTGCPYCGNELRNNTKTKSYSSVKQRMLSLYKNYYTYEENPQYINQRSKIKIYCPQHGEFIKSVQKHLSGQGCPECNIELLLQEGKLPGGYCEQIFEDNPELKNVKAFLYYLKVNNGSCYKIGITRVSPENRIKSLKSKGNSFGHTLDFQILGFRETTLYEAFQLEQQILSTYSEHRIYRKWSTELIDINIFDNIKQNFTTIF